MTEILGSDHVINQAFQDMLDLMAVKGVNSLSVELLTTTGERLELTVTLTKVEKINQQ